MYSCRNSLDICAIRASVLNADGSPDHAQVNGTAFDLSAISLGRTATSTTVTGITQEDGCGRVCVSIPDTTVTTGETLSLVLCQLNLELISILTGASVILDGSSEVIGLIAPDPAVAQLPVEFHAWSKSYSANSPAAAPLSHYHWVWPFTTWALGDWSIQRGVLQVNVTGTAQANANIDTGGFDDIPPALTEYFGVFLADDMPVASEAPYSAATSGCGFINTPAAEA